MKFKEKDIVKFHPGRRPLGEVIIKSVGTCTYKGTQYKDLCTKCDGGYSLTTSDGIHYCKLEEQAMLIKRINSFEF